MPDMQGAWKRYRVIDPNEGTARAIGQVSERKVAGVTGLSTRMRVLQVRWDQQFLATNLLVTE